MGNEKIYKVEKYKPVIQRPKPKEMYTNTIFDPLIDRLDEEDKND